MHIKLLTGRHAELLPVGPVHLELLYAANGISLGVLLYEKEVEIVVLKQQRETERETVREREKERGEERLLSFEESGIQARGCDDYKQNGAMRRTQPQIQNKVS